MKKRQGGKGKTRNAGAANGNAKLTAGKVFLVREALRRGESQRAIARRLGVTQACVGSIKRGRTWSVPA